MGWDWSEINRVSDDVLVAVGGVVLVVRQFLWRSAELHRMLRLPVVLVAVALAYLAVELRSGFRWVPGDWVVVGELALVALTGTAMGHVTRFSAERGQLRYRLTVPGLWLWAGFVAIRLGSYGLASALGADLADATGLILLSFAVNRLAAVLVVRRRAEEILATVVSRPAEATRSSGSGP